MPLIRTVAGVPRGRFQITELQREVRGRMIDFGIFSQKDLSKFLRISPVTLSRALRKPEQYPEIKKRLERFMRGELNKRRNAA